jgi:hypothetical protein
MYEGITFSYKQQTAVATNPIKRKQKEKQSSIHISSHTTSRMKDYAKTNMKQVKKTRSKAIPAHPRKQKEPTIKQKTLSLPNLLHTLLENKIHRNKDTLQNNPRIFSEQYFNRILKQASAAGGAHTAVLGEALGSSEKSFLDEENPARTNALLV